MRDPRERDRTAVRLCAERVADIARAGIDNDDVARRALQSYLSP